MNDTVLTEAEAREVARLLRPVIRTHNGKAPLPASPEERQRRQALNSALVKLAPLATE